MACGKIAYASPQEAHVAIHGMTRARGCRAAHARRRGRSPKTLKAYRCVYCGSWHLGNYAKKAAA